MHGHRDLVALGAERVVVEERTGIVHKNIDALKPTEQATSEIGSFFEVGEVCLFGFHRSACSSDRASNLIEATLVPPDGHHRALEAGEFSGSFSAEARARSCDDDDAPWARRTRLPVLEAVANDWTDFGETSHDARLQGRVDEVGDARRG